MKMIWKLAEKTGWTTSYKTGLALILYVAAFAAAGALAWLLVGRLFLSGAAGLICFIGYPAFFGGFIGGTVYLGNHEFSRKKGKISVGVNK